MRVSPPATPQESPDDEPTPPGDEPTPPPKKRASRKRPAKKPADPAGEPAKKPRRYAADGKGKRRPKPEIDGKISAVVADARRLNSLSQEELAEAAGMTVYIYSRLDCHRPSPLGRREPISFGSRAGITA